MAEMGTRGWDDARRMLGAKTPTGTYAHSALEKKHAKKKSSYTTFTVM